MNEQGEYNGKPKHAPDLCAVIQRAGAAGVSRLMITAGCLEDTKVALALARTATTAAGAGAGAGGARLYCTVGVPAPANIGVKTAETSATRVG